VAVQRRPAGAPHHGEHVARGDVALAVEEGHRAGDQLTAGEPRILAPVRIEVGHAEHPINQPRSHRQLHPRPPRNPRCQRHAVQDHAFHVNELREQAHREARRAKAVRDHVQRRLPDVLADRRHRRGVVVQGDVVEAPAVLEQVVGVAVAHPEVQAPDVVPAVEEMGHEVLVLGHDEHVGRGGQPVHHHHGLAATVPLEPQEGQPEAVLRREVVGGDLCVTDSLERVQGDLADSRHGTGRSSGCTETPPL